MNQVNQWEPSSKVCPANFVERWWCQCAFLLKERDLWQLPVVITLFLILHSSISPPIEIRKHFTCIFSYRRTCYFEGDSFIALRKTLLEGNSPSVCYTSLVLCIWIWFLPWSTLDRSITTSLFWKTHWEGLNALQVSFKKPTSNQSLCNTSRSQAESSL